MVPEYTRKAIENYRNKFDIIQVRLPKGTREKIENLGHDMSAPEYCKCAILERLQIDTESERMEELMKLVEAKKAEEAKRLEQQRKKGLEPEEEIKPPIYFDIAGNPIDDPTQYLIDMERQRERKQREQLEMIHGKEYVAALYGDSHVEPQDAKISQKPQLVESVENKAENPGNEPNKAPVDLYALQAELDAKRAREKARIEDEQKAKEQAQKEREAEYMQTVENLRNGIRGEEDAEKEARRQDSIARVQMEY